MSAGTQSSAIDPDDTMKILIASDVHLGYNEKDVIRGMFKNFGVFVSQKV